MVAATHMNPLKAECLEYYGYGTGYIGTREWFCQVCPHAVECWDLFLANLNSNRVNHHPERIEFNGEPVAAALRLPDGAPDPIAMAVLANMQRGTDDKARLVNI